MTAGIQLNGSTPTDDSADAQIGANIQLFLSESVYGSGGSITLKRVADDTTVETFLGTDSSRITISGSTVTIDPIADLDYSTAYYLEVDENAFLSYGDHIPFEGLSGSTQFNFTTAADTTPPELVSINSGGVPVSADLVLTFSEAVNGSGGNITLKRLSDHQVIETFTAVDFGQVSINGSTVTINPTADLDYSTAYYLEIAEGAFNDGRDNFNTAVTGSSYAFRTVAAPPPPSDPDPTPPNTVDGVPVQTGTTTNSDGTTSQTVTIPVVTASRSEQVGNNDVADIPLVTTGTGASLLTAQVPTGFGLTVTGSAAPKAAGSSLTDLIREIQAHTAAGSADQAQLTGGGAGFLQGLPADTPLLVQTIVPTTAAGAAPGAPLVIAGTPAAAGGAQTALVIDARTLPSDTTIQLQDVGFAAVIGAVRVTGGAGSQTVFGDSAGQYIVLGADDDTLYGGGGDDYVGSLTGNDVLHGEDGNDTVSGGADNDRLYGNAGADTLFGGRGNDSLHGGKDGDVLFGDRDADTLFGDLGADTLYGNSGDDWLNGNQDSDTLHGGQGNDTLRGGMGGDVLFGDLGDDVLWGDYGNDMLAGGAGADTFWIRFSAGHDVVTDFNAAEGDRIGLMDNLSHTARADAAGDAVIVFSDGNDLTLQGVKFASLNGAVPASWFVRG